MWRAVRFEREGGPRILGSLAELKTPSASEGEILWLDLHSPGPEEVAVLSDDFHQGAHPHGQVHPAADARHGLVRDEL
jgi:hypothetical protein